jgi:predicted anti-sigma-YlaC factor YlaD
MDRQALATHLSQWQDHLQDSLDGALVAAEQAKLDEHLSTCAECRAEQTKLLALHALFERQLGNAPTLSADFSARVLASVDEQEQARRAAAKVRAERDFQKRRQAFELDWRSLWQRHMGSIVAGTTTIAAVAAMLGATWSSLRGQFLSAFPTLASLQSEMPTTVLILAASIAVSATSFWVLRSKGR